MKLKEIFDNGNSCVKRVVITPEMATFWIDRYKYSKQRKVSIYQVRKLCNSIAIGEYNEQTVICFALVDNKYYLIDGQHRLLAVIKSNTAVASNVSVKSFDNMDDVSIAYATIDIGGPRGQNASMGYLEGKTQLSKSEIGWTKAAIRKIYTGFKPRSDAVMLTPLIIADLVIEWEKYALDYLRCINFGENKKKLVKSSLFALGMITFKYSNELSHEFWKQVSYNDGLKIGDPRRVTIRHINENYRISQSSNMLTPYVFTMIIERTWMHFVKGNEIRRVRVDPQGILSVYSTLYNTSVDGYGIDAGGYFDVISTNGLSPMRFVEGRL